MKISLSIDREIERIAGLFEAALGHDRLGRDHIGARPLLQTRGVVGRLRRKATGLGLIFIKQIGEYRPHFFETGRIEVGQIIGDHIHLGLFAFETGANDGKRLHQFRILRSGAITAYDNVRGLLWPCPVANIIRIISVCIWNVREVSIMFIIIATVSALLSSNAPTCSRTLASACSGAVVS